MELKYNVNPRKNPNYKGLSPVLKDPIPCPNIEDTSHEIEFSLNTFISWYENFYAKSGEISSHVMHTTNVSAYSGPSHRSQGGHNKFQRAQSQSQYPSTNTNNQNTNSPYEFEP